MSISVMHKPAILLGTGSNTSTPSDPDAFNLLTDGFVSLTIPSNIGIINGLRTDALYSAGILKNLDFNNVEIIPSGCCLWNRKLENIVGSNVYRISRYAFASNYALKSIDVGNVLFIESYAFSNCYVLSSAEFLSNAISVGNNCFEKCSALETAMPNSIADFDYGVFRSCYSLKNFEFGYGSYRTEGMFTSCSNLEFVKFNAQVQIGSNCFNGCFNLSSLINNDFIVATIQYSAFRNCYNLSSFFAPLVTGISSSAFENCSALSVVTVSPYVLASCAFRNCSSLESLYLLYCGITTLVNKNVFEGTPMSDSSYLGHFGSIYVPSSWVASYKTATNWAMYSDRITSLPANFDSDFVYVREFYNQSTALTEIPSEKANAQYVCPDAFYNCRMLTGINMPNVKAIGQNAFAVCRSVSFASIPLCKHVGSWAFSGISALKEIYAPNLTLVSTDAFVGANYIESLTFSPNCKVIYLAAQYRLSSISFSEVLSINCYPSNATFVSLPKAKKVILADHLMSSIFLPEAVILGGINGKNLEYADLPKAVYLGPAFSGCSKLTEVSIPSARELYNFTFYRCSSLSHINIDNVWLIGSSTFENCIGMSEISFKKAETLGEKTFYNCYNIKRILTCNLIWLSYSSTFARCESLESLYLLKNDICSLSYSNIFDSTPIVESSYLGHYGSIYVPSQLLSWYKTQNVWSFFKDRFVGLTQEEITDIINNW